MEYALLYEDYWDVVKDDARYPQSLLEEQGDCNDDGELIVTRKAPTSQEWAKIEDEQGRWKNQNANVRALIMQKCEEWPRDVIEDVDTAHEQWSKLQELCQDSGFASRHYTLQELLCTSLTSCGNSVDTYVMTIQAKANDLKKMNAGIPEWFIVSILLSNLDGKYRNYAQRVIRTIGIDEPDLEDIIDMLFREDRYRSMRRT